MKLHTDSRRLLRHAWSVRFIVIGAILQGLDSAMSLLEFALPVSPVVLIFLKITITGGAFVSRFVVQKEFKNGS